MKNKNVIICSDGKFPRGDATGNYIQFMALALILKEYNVFVVSNGKNNPKEYSDEQGCYIYKNIKYFNFVNSGNGKFANWSSILFSGKRALDKVREISKDINPHIILYSSNCFFIKPILSFARKEKMAVSACVTEWLQPFQFKRGIFEPWYIQYYYNFHYVIPKIKRVIPISRGLDEYFKKRGCKTLCLPIMADTHEYTYNEKMDKHDAVIRLIYSGNALNKDAFQVMIGAILKLVEEGNENIEFHLTGLKMKDLKNVLGTNSDMIKKLGSHLIIHSWMEYDELVNLYQQMDFLLIARENNISTKSNFPSKVPELMCFGVVPIVSKVGDYTAYYLEDGVDSIIFEECSVKTCAEAIKRAILLTASEHSAMSRNARECAETKFDYHVWANRLSEYIENE